MSFCGGYQFRWKYSIGLACWCHHKFGGPCNLYRWKSTLNKTHTSHGREVVADRTASRWCTELEKTYFTEITETQSYTEYYQCIIYSIWRAMLVQQSRYMTPGSRKISPCLPFNKCNWNPSTSIVLCSMWQSCSMLCYRCFSPCPFRRRRMSWLAINHHS